MVVYSISDIEKLSGVKAHTLRVWEKRYSILPNRRTESNIRYYLDEDLQFILNIALLNRQGLKISKIASLDREEIKQKVADVCQVDEVFEGQIDGLMLSMFELNKYKFLKIINHQIEVNGFEATMNDIIYPMLDKLSTMWVAGSVKGVHEIFVSNIVREKLIVEIDKLSYNVADTDLRFMIYLPENESHELSLLYMNFLLKKYGANVLSLGSNVPLIDVLSGAEIYKPDYVFTLFNDSFSDMPLQPYLNQLSKTMSKTKVIISGYQTVKQNVILHSNIIRLSDLNSIREYVMDVLQVA